MTETVLIDYDHILVDQDKFGAILFEIDEREIWIPRSLVEDIWEEDRRMEIPLWFAVKKELT